MFTNIFTHRKRIKNTWVYIFRSVLSKDYNIFSGYISREYVYEDIYI